MADHARLADQAVTRLSGVGPRQAERLRKLGIHSLQDLLFHLPLRYEDRTRLVPLGQLREGMHCLVEGEIELAEVVQGRRRRLVCRIGDGSGFLNLYFFHFYPQQVARLRRGLRLRCFGEVRGGPGMLQMVHPEYEPAADARPGEQAGLTPIYPATEGLRQASLRKLVDQALALLAQGGELQDWLPEAARLGLPSLAEALHYLHRPPPDAPVEEVLEGRHPCRRRLALEELLAHHLSLRRLRQEQEAISRAPVLRGGEPLVARFLEGLPFELTGAQRRVVAEVEADLARESAMLRLVQGDVGSGKTVVAALAALRCVGAGYQAAIMAPTELLAEQHYRNFSQWLSPLGLKVDWMSGRLGVRKREAAVARLLSGETRVVVGTHALFQESVQFQRLGLVIVDEQHRFGVHQRLALKEKGHQGDSQPHQLIMTATPIPRTLAMTAYADLDVSVIDELPPGRTPVRTVALAATRREDVMARVREACAQGRQAYWVCTLVEESELLQAQAAEETARLLTEALTGLRVGLVHGRMRGADKEAVMGAFAAGELDLLVATTVIEVGVDVPNASLMIIENAERLGLSQLHQLRGRVGRGQAASSCVLLYQSPLSRTARARLSALRETNDGFEIARRDLAIRGPGEFLGTRQTGELQYRVAELERDGDLLPRVQALAERLLAERPQAVAGLIRRWVGQGERYSQV
ncbi:ATP-dependent DNA helicase RecG [Alkalilimnicola sp. S0819]|uniref:ATP-dependent DNA helicase RecG n=1 Tax=Alkalilimnicola sp. S0819 TaxID=2613922 RepID=UPI00126153AB|nr:ATP-dependent DNA helicase RecG [Alkalilimnicola sp. S0819]KAB7624426.1 ATP-dependent DNA helicase RecG [Alkalilimnicola sp. S0819]MPQ16257.1 ATP-dependent DNA helicase RecG [Alkalilimnicola sp. S0819]